MQRWNSLIHSVSEPGRQSDVRLVFVIEYLASYTALGCYNAVDDVKRYHYLY